MDLSTPPLEQQEKKPKIVGVPPEFRHLLNPEQESFKETYKLNGKKVERYDRLYRDPTPIPVSIERTDIDRWAFRRRNGNLLRPTDTHAITAHAASSKPSVVNRATKLFRAYYEDRPVTQAETRKWRKN